jgi:hypothetical protein
MAACNKKNSSVRVALRAAEFRRVGAAPLIGQCKAH